MVMWLHILVGPCWCVYVALFGSRLQSTSKQCNGSFGSRLLPNSATYTHKQGPTNTCSHITTHWCILIGYFNNCNFRSTSNVLPDDWCDCTGTCWSCFNVNFKIVFKTIHWCISWWIKKLIISRCTVCMWGKKKSDFSWVFSMIWYPPI